MTNNYHVYLAGKYPRHNTDDLLPQYTHTKNYFDLFFRNNFPNNVQTKRIPEELDLSRRILLWRGFRSFSGASVRPGLIF